MSFIRTFSYLPPLLKRHTYLTFILQKRNTVIVKRRFEPPVTKPSAKVKRRLKAKHYIYDVIEDTELTEPPDLQVVLTSFVEGVGDVGDVISLIPEYARNHFLLPKKAVYATPENIEKYTALKKNRPERPAFSSIHAGMTMRILSKCVIPVFMNPEMPWSIEINHIYLAFRNEKFYVPEECIELPSSSINGPDATKEGKDFAVFITINNTERFPVRCRLYHIKPGFETAKLTEEYYVDKNEPILEEQKELLEEMPLPEIMDDPSTYQSIVEKYRIQYIK